MASQSHAYGLQEQACSVRHYFLLVCSKRQFKSDNLGSGETCPRWWKLLSPSLLFSSIGVGSGTVSLEALLSVPVVWGTSSWFARTFFSNLFSFKAVYLNLVSDLDKSCELVDVQTSHTVADLYKMIAWCLCAFSYGQIVLWMNCSEDEICLSIKQNCICL